MNENTFEAETMAMVHRIAVEEETETRTAERVVTEIGMEPDDDVMCLVDPYAEMNAAFVEQARLYDQGPCPQFIAFFNPETDPLSQTVIELLDEMAGWNEELDDLNAYGAPSECGRDVARSQMRRVFAIIAKRYPSPEAFYRVFKSGVDQNWAYWKGLPGYWVSPEGQVVTDR